MQEYALVFEDRDEAPDEWGETIDEARLVGLAYYAGRNDDGNYCIECEPGDAHRIESKLNKHLGVELELVATEE